MAPAKSAADKAAENKDPKDPVNEPENTQSPAEDSPSDAVQDQETDAEGPGVDEVAVSLAKQKQAIVDQARLAMNIAAGLVSNPELKTWARGDIVNDPHRKTVNERRIGEDLAVAALTIAGDISSTIQQFVDDKIQELITED